MKKLLLVLFFIVTLGVNACSSSKNSVFNQQIGHDDYLIYLMNDQGLMLYDPVNVTHTPILSNWDIDDFTLNINNRLAFSSSRDGNDKLYILDFPFTENIPVEISLDSAIENTPLSWSPDGHYLLFKSAQENEKKLFIWDGKNVFDIYSYHKQVNEITWSPSGQLAFTDFYTFVLPNDEHDFSEIFLWDGNTTVSISQNPSGEDRFPTWNNDSQLAFLSKRNGEYNIFVWDGMSKDNGVPNAKTFLNIAPELTEYYSHPTWTNTNSIAFGGPPGLVDGFDIYVQIYEWDGRSIRNISKNPFAHNGGQTWRSDGYWAFITFFSTSQNLYIRDEANRTVLKTKGQYTPAWSQNGLLLFCVPDSPNWTLSLWNSKIIIELAHGEWINAKWNNGESVFCSFG